MIRIKLGKCCMDCKYAVIKVKETKLEKEPLIDIACKHANYCAEYADERLQALPAEQIFGEGATA